MAEVTINVALAKIKAAPENSPVMLRKSSKEGYIDVVFAQTVEST